MSTYLFMKFMLDTPDDIITQQTLEAFEIPVINSVLS